MNKWRASDNQLEELTDNIIDDVASSEYLGQYRAIVGEVSEGNYYPPKPNLIPQRGIGNTVSNSKRKSLRAKRKKNVKRKKR